MMQALLGLVMSAALLFVGGPAFAQSADELRALRNDLQTLRDEQIRMRGELQAIKDVLRGRLANSPPPEAADRSRNVLLSFSGEHAKGNKGARLVLVDFTDYQ